MNEVNQEDIKEMLYSYYTKGAMDKLKVTTYFYSTLCKISGIDKYYNPIVRDAANLLYDFCPNRSVHEYFYVYQFMLKNGYFSIQPFKYKDISDIIFKGRCVMGGRGNCLHISGFYQDILKEMSVSMHSKVASSIIYVFLPDDTMESEMLNNGVVANHVTNLVRQNGEYYIQDATNNLLFSTHHLLENNPRLCCSSILQNESIMVFPETFMACSSFSEKDLIYYLQQMNDSNSISKEELKEIKKRIKNHCKENLDVFQDFYQRNINDIETVYRKVKKLGCLELK